MNTQPEYIYVLELNDGNYYIGKTKDIVKRFNDHKSSKGSVWTKIHGGCKIIDIMESKSLFDEDKYTLEYMNMVGVDKVRGGSYSNSVLSIEQLNNITRALRNANNLCMLCGESDHFADMCSVSDYTSSTESTRTENMQAELYEPSVKYLSPEGIVHNNTETHTNSMQIVCKRCGRNNHTTTKCFAKTDVYGKVL